MTENRLNKIVHDTKHRVAEIYIIIKNAMNKVDKKLEQILLDKQELDEKPRKKSVNKKDS